MNVFSFQFLVFSFNPLMYFEYQHIYVNAAEVVNNAV